MSVVIGFVGFMLSPLSWWNDLFINVPLAVGFGWCVAFFYPPAFKVAVVIGYWLTNVLGFFLMHKGIANFARSNSKPSPTKLRWGKDLLIASSYTIVILILIKLQVIKPLALPTAIHE